MLWHLIDNRGTIVRSVTTDTRKKAQALLGAGSVVSDASWRLDVHKWKPVETVITGIEQSQARKRLPPMPKGYTSTADVAKRLGLTERRVQMLVAKHHLRVAQFDRGRYGFTERQIIQLAQFNLRTNEQCRSAVAKRVSSYLEHCRQRYIDRASRR